MSPDPQSVSKSKSELMDFHKTYEQQERQKRHAEREAKRKAEEEKAAKLQNLGTKDPTAAEKVRIATMKEEMERKKQMIEKAQLDRELAAEQRARDERERKTKREGLFEHLEVKRRERSVDAEQGRVAAEVEHTSKLQIGSGLPTVFVF